MNASGVANPQRAEPLSYHRSEAVSTGIPKQIAHIAKNAMYAPPGDIPI